MKKYRYDGRKPIFFVDDEIQGLRDAKNLLKKAQYYIEVYEKQNW